MGASRAALALVALTVLGGWTVSGCSSDLFHDTSWPSACELDPTTPGCPGVTGDAGDAGGEAGVEIDGSAD